MNCNADKAADDLKALLDFYKIKKVNLVGHDWGAGVAYRFSLKYQERLHKLVILNMIHPLAKTNKLPFAQILKSWYVFFFQLNGIAELALKANNFGSFRGMLIKSHYTKDDMIRLTEAHNKHPKSATRMLNWYRYWLRYEIPNKSIAIPNKKIEVPMKMIWGKDDIAIHIDASKISMDKELVTNGEVVYLDTHHFVQHGKPDEVNEEIFKFLKK